MPPTKLAAEYRERKIKKIPTHQLEAAKVSGYFSEDVVTGERFFLSVSEVADEMKHRDEVALALAQSMFGEFNVAIARPGSVQDVRVHSWAAVGDQIQAGWIAAAKSVIERYRCLL